MNSRCRNKMIATLGTKRKIFFNFFPNPIRNQEVFTVLLVAIAVDHFCSSSCRQEYRNSLHIFLCGMRSCES